MHRPKSGFIVASIRENQTRKEWSGRVDLNHH